MKKIKRYPQFVLMLDLLMLVLFVLISITSHEQKGIRYHFIGDEPPPESYLIHYDLPKPTMHYDDSINEWIESNGIIDPVNTTFINCENIEAYAQYLDQIELNSGQLIIGMYGKMADKVKDFIFNTCSKENCDKLNIYIDSEGQIFTK